MKKRIPSYALIAVLVVLALSRFGLPSTVTKTAYFSPVWSPDGKSIAYVRRSMEYSYSNPLIHLPIVTPDTTYSFNKDSVELVVSGSDGSSARVIKDFKMPLGKTDPTDIGTITAKIIWFKQGYLQYAVTSYGFTTDLDSGNNFIRPDGKGDTWVSSTEDAKSKIINPAPTVSGGKELYPLGGSSAIFVFDHNKKTVTLLVGEKSVPLPKYRSQANLPNI